MSAPPGSRLPSQTRTPDPGVRVPPRRSSRFTKLGDVAFRIICQAGAVLVVLLAVLLFVILLWQSWLAIQPSGGRSLTRKPGAREESHRHFGALAFIYGTLATSAIAMLVAVPLGVGTAV